jgi:hypothetical protein
MLQTIDVGGCVCILDARSKARIPLAMRKGNRNRNNDGWENDPDARQWSWCIAARRRSIAIRPIITSAIFIPVIIRPSMLVAAGVMFSHISIVTFSHVLMLILAKSRDCVYAADHNGKHKPQYDRAHDGPKSPCICCFHKITPFSDRVRSSMWRHTLLVGCYRSVDFVFSMASRLHFFSLQVFVADRGA